MPTTDECGHTFATPGEKCPHCGETAKIIEERTAGVTLTIKLTTRIYFSPIERESRITKSDFIDNAVGSLPHDFFTTLEGEGWAVAYPIDGEVHDE